MDEGRTAYIFRVPDHLSGCFPPLAEHLVEPEVTRDVIVGGRRVVDLPSEGRLSGRGFCAGPRLSGLAEAFMVKSVVE